VSTGLDVIPLARPLIGIATTWIESASRESASGTCAHGCPV